METNTEVCTKRPWDNYAVGKKDFCLRKNKDWYIVMSGLQLNGQPWEQEKGSSEKQTACISLCCYQLTEGEGVGRRGHRGLVLPWANCGHPGCLLLVCLNVVYLTQGNWCMGINPGYKHAEDRIVRGRQTHHSLSLIGEHLLEYFLGI